MSTIYYIFLIVIDTYIIIFDLELSTFRSFAETDAMKLLAFSISVYQDIKKYRNFAYHIGSVVQWIE